MSEAWFRPKKIGYGSGLPCSWQGWAVLIAYLAIILGAGSLLKHHHLAFIALAVPATVLLMIVAAKTTDGGWRWRSGRDA